MLSGQLITFVGGPGLTRRRQGSHIVEAIRVGMRPPPLPPTAPRIPPTSVSRASCQFLGPNVEACKAGEQGEDGGGIYARYACNILGGTATADQIVLTV